MEHTRRQCRVHSGLTEHLGEMLHGARTAGGDQRHLADRTHRRQLFHVEAAASAVTAHAVEYDLAGAARLHLAHPVLHRASAVARALRIAAEQPRPIARRGLQAVDAHHDALGAKALTQVPDERRILERWGVDGHFLGAGIEHRLGIGHRADAAGDAKRNVEQARHAPHPLPVHGSPLRARGDVVEDELIGARVAIARGELQDVACDAMVAEAHAFYDLAVAYVEAGDDPSGKYGRNSSQLIRCSNSALPLTAAVTPVRARAAKSAASRTPPDACQARSGKRAT